MNYYGNGGQARTCPGVLLIKSVASSSGIPLKKTLLAQVVVNASAGSSDMLAPTNILGIAPGTLPNHTAIVRQWDLVKLRLCFASSTFTVVPRLGLDVRQDGRTRVSVPLHPRQLVNLCVVPYLTEWRWSDGTTTTWRQYMVNSQVYSEDMNSGQSGPRILICLDTGTSLDLSSTEVASSPQYSPTDHLCESVCLYFATGDGIKISPKDANLLNKSVLYGNQMLQTSDMPSEVQGDFQTALDRVNSQLFVQYDTNEQAKSAIIDKSSLTRLEFKISRYNQKAGLVTIPQFAANLPDSNTLEFILGISSIVASYGAIEIEYEKSTKLPLKWTFIGDSPIL